MPIGNLTSQIFANIYLNEFDQFVLHSLKPLGYVRYGDDFVLWTQDEFTTKTAQIVGTQFLNDELYLLTNPKHDSVQPTYGRLPYLGVDLWPNGRRLQKATKKRISGRLNHENMASYQSIVRQHQPARETRNLNWKIVDILDGVW